MALFPALSDLGDAAKRLLGLVVGEPAPLTSSPAATPTLLQPLTETTVAALRATIDEHDRGLFLRSGLLADLITRDADIFGALTQRLLKLQSHPIEIEPASDDAAAVSHAEFIEDLWPTVVSPAAQHDLMASLVLLGLAVGQLIWSTDEASGELVPTLDPWPSSSVEYQPILRQWYVHTRDQGRLPITPGDGQWVLLTARSVHRPQMWGALRCTAEWYLRNALSANDASRQAEVHGIPVWAARLPAGARETPDGRAFVRSIRAMGRNAVIPLPRGRTEEESYGLELVEAQSDAWAVFQFLQTLGGGKIRLAILGQDLTSQNNKVGTNASSQTGEGVTEDIVEADAHAASAIYTSQISKPWTRFRLGDTSLTPCVEIDAEPEADAKADAEALGAEADALAKWKSLGVNVDTKALAMERGLPVLADPPAPKTPPPPTAPPEQPEADPTDAADATETPPP